MLLPLGWRGARIDAELVGFVNAGAVPTSASTSGKGVLLDSPAAVSEFTGRLAGRNPEAAARLQARLAAVTTGPGRVLLGFTGLGCAENGARLRRRGADLVAEFTGGKGNVCVAASQLAAVFAVNRSDMAGKR